jgi:hypothetical protein
MNEERNDDRLSEGYSAACDAVWKTLSKIDCNEHTEDKNGLTYLSWAWAYQIVMQHFPTFDYVFGSPFSTPMTTFDDGSVQVTCTVSVVHNGHVICRDMWLPVMDYRNRAIVNPNAMQINTAKMRCMTKAISMLGLGAYIYAGEDLPSGSEPERDKAPEKPKKVTKKKAATKKAAVPESEDDEDTSVFAEFEDEEGAQEVADMMIELAAGMHANSLKGLVGFWQKNKAVIDALDKDYPDQYARVKKVFTKLRTKLQEEKDND